MKNHEAKPPVLEKNLMESMIDEENAKGNGQKIERHEDLFAIDIIQRKLRLSTNGGNFDYSNCKDRMKKQGKKDEMKWKILVRTKTIRGAPFFSRHLLAI
ncbi:hypothetical protein Patl1_36757 [Pistacia atlantica]|nr:hypothetical protein Patl1_36757 [Pistacia atlantica]